MKYQPNHLKMNNIEISDSLASDESSNNEELTNHREQSIVIPLTIPKLNKIHSDSEAAEYFNQIIKEKEDLINYHIDKIRYFQQNIDQNSKIFENITNHSSQRTWNQSMTSSRYAGCETLIDKCDIHITNSKRHLLYEITKIEIDKYLIGKLKEINDTDPYRNDRRFFQTVFNFNKDYFKLKNKEGSEDEAHFQLLLSLLDEIQKMRNSGLITLKSGINKLLTDFIYRSFSRKFIYAIAYFSLKFIKQIDWLNKKSSKIAKEESRNTQIEKLIIDLDKKINSRITNFNTNFEKFLEKVFFVDNSFSSDLIFNSLNSQIDSDFQQSALQEFGVFFESEWNGNFKFVETDFCFFMSLEIDLPLENDERLKNIVKIYYLSKEQIYETFKNILLNIILIAGIVINNQIQVVNTFYYNLETIEEFLKQENEFDIFEVNNLKIHRKFYEKFFNFYSLKVKIESEKINKSVYLLSEIEFQLDSISQSASDKIPINAKLLLSFLKIEKIKIKNDKTTKNDFYFEILEDVLFDFGNLENFLSVQKIKENIGFVFKIGCFDFNSDIKTKIEKTLKKYKSLQLEIEKQIIILEDVFSKDLNFSKIFDSTSKICRNVIGYLKRSD